MLDMKNTHDLDEFLQFQGTLCQRIAYHSTNLLAGTAIEESGFLPNKIFLDCDHQRFTQLAQRYGVWDLKPKCSSLSLGFQYENWLSMRSVTFTKCPQKAIAHIKDGHSSGQGLTRLKLIIDPLLKRVCDKKERDFLEGLNKKICEIQKAKPVTYIVDLSNLNLDEKDPNLFHYRFNFNGKPPEKSVVEPDRILMKFIH